MYVKPGKSHCGGKALYTVDLLVLTSLDQLLLVYKILFSFLQNKLNEEVNCTEPPSSVSVPWQNLYKKNFPNPTMHLLIDVHEVPRHSAE